MVFYVSDDFLSVLERAIVLEIAHSFPLDLNHSLKFEIGDSIICWVIVIVRRITLELFNEIKMPMFIFSQAPLFLEDLLYLVKCVFTPVIL